MNPWLLLTKYRIERCCSERYCRKWTVRECITGDRVYPYEWDSWKQAFAEVQGRQARQYFSLTGKLS